MQSVDESTPSARRTVSPAIGHSYVLITPARNEAQYIESAIQSVARQTILPMKWVIVSDGSTDGTDEVVSKYAAQYPWIELLNTSGNGERHFAGKVHAFNAGYARVKDLGYDVIGNLDADASLDQEDFFEFLLSKFLENPKLGCCGTAYREGDVIYPYRFTSLEDVSGACQIFRRECFEAIGGYLPLRAGGIDVIAVFSAQASGWETRTFTERMFQHHRTVASAQHAGVYQRIFKGGEKDYLLGSHPAWEFFRGLYQMKNKPYILGGVLMLVGYFWAMCSSGRTIPPELMKRRQETQMERLKGIPRRMLGFGR